MGKKVVDLQRSDSIELLNLVFDICTDSTGKKTESEIKFNVEIDAYSYK